jgi:hypothetical protein
LGVKVSRPLAADILVIVPSSMFLSRNPSTGYKVDLPLVYEPRLLVLEDHFEKLSITRLEEHAAETEEKNDDAAMAMREKCMVKRMKDCTQSQLPPTQQRTRVVEDRRSMVFQSKFNRENGSGQPRSARGPHQCLRVQIQSRIRHDSRNSTGRSP